MMSDNINELAAALSSFQGEMKAVSFDAVNPYFKSRYATLSALVDAASPVLAKNGLSVSQLCTGDGAVTTMLIHKSGQYIGDTLKLTPTKNDPQGLGSAITYARRYAYASILGLVSEADDDGNSASTPIKPLTASVQAVKEAISAIKPSPATIEGPSLEFKGILVFTATKEGVSKASGKPYKVTTYTVDSDLGQINIDVFGSAVESNPGAELTFFEFKKGEFKGKPQFSASKALVSQKKSILGEETWEE